MSNSKTSTPIFAKWQAIPEPITPEPNTAAFLILFVIPIDLIHLVKNERIFANHKNTKHFHIKAMAC
jgi:hypothetical protein